MSSETWVDVQDYEGLYQVSDLGRVRRVKGKVLRNVVTSRGYLQVTLSKNNVRTSALVHILVAQHFIPNPEGYPIVNHMDEDKGNARRDNLEWCTSQHNSEYSLATPYSALSPDGVLYEGENLTAFCDEHRLDKGNLSQVLLGNRADHKGWIAGEHTLNVSGQWWTLKFEQGLRDRHECWGLTVPTERLILVDPALRNRAELATTIVHEILHALYEVSGLQLRKRWTEEEIVTNMSPHLCSFISNNRTVMQVIINLNSKGIEDATRNAR